MSCFPRSLSGVLQDCSAPQPGDDQCGAGDHAAVPGAIFVLGPVPGQAYRCVPQMLDLQLSITALNPS